MKLLAEACDLKRIIREPTVNRPGLALSGFTRYFAYKRVQVMGHAEVFYLRELRTRRTRSAVCVSVRLQNSVHRFQPRAEAGQGISGGGGANGRAGFSTPLVTMKFINLATLALEMMFAPRGTELGSMVDILGVGALIRGESGIGKSESVLALIERGYSLVADDVVKATLVDGREVLCTSAELTRDHMEVRGIGIINVGAMFGVKAIRKEKSLDLIITLKPWEEVKDMDRLGIEQEFAKVLGVDIPHLIIPVRPGRDIARLIEVAAFQIKLRKSGYIAAEELNKRLLTHMADKTSAPPLSP